MLTVTQLIGFMAGGDEPLVKLIQQVQVTIAAGATEGTATLPTPVSSVLLATEHFQGYVTTNISSTSQDEVRARAKLTAVDTVTLYRNTSDATFTVIGYVTVIEWMPSAIKSIVRGEIALASTVTSATDTVSVEKDNTLIFYLGDTCDGSTSNVAARFTTDVELTDDATVTARRADGTGATNTGYVLLEFNAGVLDGIVQHSTVTVPSAGATAVATLGTSVDRTRSIIGFGGCSSSSANDNHGRMAHLTFTADNEVTGTKTLTSGGDAILYFCVAQFRSFHVVSLERGTITIAGGATTGDDAITAVVAAQTLPNYLGYTTGSNTTTPECYPHVHLQAVDNVRATRNTLDATLTVTVSHETIQFKI